ncbi:hypothetical protein CN140_01145 [Sinorhizobium meliloti]|uniref:4-fold beta flower protein n=1 Tax=Rhizobium meliloti TaxID=382 RepID=UPI000FD7F3BC|nr:hypothetical protein [Sinorhizobium meliloti]RVL87571.1 hypothetical protein CN140_01145 [Sinorhizobium meliloti]
MELYDRNGDARVYTVDGVHFFTWGGQPVAYLHGDNVYGFGGNHLGWLVNGNMYNRNGDCILFAAAARGGPMKPLRNLKPLKGLKGLKPLKGLRELAPLKPLFSRSWADCPF